MTLNEYAASKKRAIFENLLAGREPGEGSYDETVLAEARAKGKPQMGTTVFRPDAIELEFIYADPKSSATVLRVTLAPPERIVFLPIPEWVVESIWEGEVHGSHHFESDAMRLYRELGESLETEANAGLFGARAPTGKN